MNGFQCWPAVFEISEKMLDTMPVRVIFATALPSRPQMNGFQNWRAMFEIGEQNA